MKITRTVTATTEPVSLVEQKAFMRVVFADEDSLISSLIKTARVALENYLGISIVKQDIELTVSGYWTPFRIPYAPIVSIDSILIDEIEYDPLLIATDGYIETMGNVLKMEYSAGFDVIPEDLKTAIKSMTMYYFDNRGDIGAIPSGILTLIQPYNANLFL
jgi:hypothetical protein